MEPRSRDHVLTGRLTLLLRILQFIIALVIVGLAGYGLSFLVFSGVSLNMFTAIFTVLFCIYCICASTFLVAFYNYWAVIFFDVMGFIFWLTSFALLTSQVRPFFASYYYDNANCDFYYYGACYYKRDLDAVSGAIQKRATTNIYTYRNSMAAAAALAGLNWLLFIVTLITTVVYVARHRKAGGHAMYGRAATVHAAHEAKGDLESQRASNATTGVYIPAATGVYAPAATHQSTAPEMQGLGPPPPPPMAPAPQQQSPYPNN